MKHSRAIKVLRTFSPDEFKEFGKLVNSPFFNNNKNLSKLYTFLKKHYPEFEFNSEQAFKHLYPGKKFYDAKVRQLFAEMYKLCEEFLAQGSLSKNDFNKKYHIIAQLDIRKLDDLFLNKVKKLEKAFNRNQIDRYFFENKAKFEYEKEEFYINHGRQDLAISHVYVRAIYDLNVIFKLLQENLSDIIAIEDTYGKFPNVNIINSFAKCIDLESFSKFIEKYPTKDYMYISINCNILLMYFDRDESYYFKAKKIFVDNFELFDNYIKKAILSQLRNYCVLRNTNILFRKEAFELDKLNVPLAEAEYFDSGIHLSPVTYMSMVTNALYFKEYKWVEEFMENVTRYVHKNESENVRNLAMAFLSFNKFKFEESLKYLNKVKLTIPSIKHDYKLLKLEVFYELDMIEPGLSALDSFSHFIYNTKELSNRIKLILQSYLEMMRRLYKLKIQNEKLDKEAILEFIYDLNQTPIPTKKWFLEKLKELEVKITSKPYLKKTFATS